MEEKGEVRYRRCWSTVKCVKHTFPFLAVFEVEAPASVQSERITPTAIKDRDFIMDGLIVWTVQLTKRQIRDYLGSVNQRRRKNYDRQRFVMKMQEG
jgi:hypothetical protein